MTAKLITAIPRLIARPFLRNPLTDTWIYVFYYGFLKGYALDNIVWLCQQAVLETGNGSSVSLVQDNNPFGMSEVNTRPTTQTGGRPAPEGNTRGIYASIGDAVLDRFMWDEYFGIKGEKTSSGYPGAVAARYYPSGNYATAVSAVDTAQINRAALITAIVLPLEILILSKYVGEVS